MIPQMQMARERAIAVMALPLAHLAAKVKRDPQSGRAFNPP
jgi:hypothetical protein